MIGDPEMPIFTWTPEPMDNVSAFYNKDGSLSINTGDPQTRICITSASDSTYYNVNRAENWCVTNPPKDVHICFTRHNFIPKEIDLNYYDSFSPSEGLGEIISCDPVPFVDNLYIKYSFNYEYPRIAYVVITSVYSGEQEMHPLPPFTDEIHVDTSKYATGYYVVTMFVDGYPTGSSMKIKKL